MFNLFVVVGSVWEINIQKEKPGQRSGFFNIPCYALLQFASLVCLGFFTKVTLVNWSLWHIFITDVLLSSLIPFVIWKGNIEGSLSCLEKTLIILFVKKF